MIDHRACIKYVYLLTSSKRTERKCDLLPVTGATISCLKTEALVLDSLHSETVLLQTKIFDIARSN